MDISYVKRGRSYHAVIFRNGIGLCLCGNPWCNAIPLATGFQAKGNNRPTPPKTYTPGHAENNPVYASPIFIGPIDTAGLQADREKAAREWEANHPNPSYLLDDDGNRFPCSQADAETIVADKTHCPKTNLEFASNGSVYAVVYHDTVGENATLSFVKTDLRKPKTVKLRLRFCFYSVR